MLDANNQPCLSTMSSLILLFTSKAPENTSRTSLGISQGLQQIAKENYLLFVNGLKGYKYVFRKKENTMMVYNRNVQMIKISLQTFSF